MAGFLSEYIKQSHIVRKYLLSLTNRYQSKRLPFLLIALLGVGILIGHTMHSENPQNLLVSAERENKMKQSTFEALLRVYERLDDIVRYLNDLAEIELELEAFDDASLLQARADILYEQMVNLDVVISELEG